MEDLRKHLLDVDGRGYKAYKDIQGQYQFEHYILSIDYVQGDPFASPSRIRVIVQQSYSKFPIELFEKNYKRIAVVDFLTRLLARKIKKLYDGVGGSGKSGLLSVDFCGQEILDRTSVVINAEKIEGRLEVGLPAAGRRVLGKSAAQILIEALPKIVEETFVFSKINTYELVKQVQLAEDQAYIRKQLEIMGLTAFVANHSILPRESGISQKPLTKNVVPFKSPKSLEVEMELPHRGIIKGMGIPKGITLIVGGGYHGKSTLLKALESGVYDHIEEDGREYVITVDDAVKIRAEDGRRIEKVNISPFINNLPNKNNTKEFTTENASGSTSQAANIIEALEIGTNVLLIDEDTSATNFMIRDTRMQQLVHSNKEPITPFIDKVRQLYKEQGVSTILVIGGSGDYFDVADTVIMMDEYIPREVTKEAKEIAAQSPYKREINENQDFGTISHRKLLSATFPKDQHRLKVKTHGLHTITFERSNIDLQNVEQLMSFSQTNEIGMILQYIMKDKVDDEKTIRQIIEEVYKDIEEKGLDIVSTFKGHPGNLAFPRKYETAAALNRFRHLRTGR